VNGQEYKSVQILANDSIVPDFTQVTPYPAVNGFLIDQTGELEITIDYPPHKWFQLGLALSLATLSLSFIYLVWQKWKKGKEIKMVQKPGTDSSMTIATMSTNGSERMKNNLLFRSCKYVLIYALILLLSLPFLMVLHQDNQDVSIVMLSTYALLISGGVPMAILLILDKRAAKADFSLS
jgi:hypothetical protein